MTRLAQIGTTGFDPSLTDSATLNGPFNSELCHDSLLLEARKGTPQHQ